MRYMIIDTSKKMKTVKEGAMSISPESQLDWIGMNDEGVRITLDSKHLLHCRLLLLLIPLVSCGSNTEIIGCRCWIPEKKRVPETKRTGRLVSLKICSCACRARYSFTFLLGIS